MEENKPQLPPVADPVPLPPGFSGQLPLPVGAPMRVINPTAGEREELEKIGWKDGDPVPENMAELMEYAKAMASEDNLPPPVDPRTPPVTMPEAVEIDSLPPAEKQKALQVLQSVLQQAQQQDQQPQGIAGAPEGVNEAIATAMNSAGINILEDDTESDTYATGEPKQEPAQPTPAAPAQGPCENCGYDHEAGEIIEVTDSDKTNFLQSMLGQATFYKAYSFFGDKMSVVVRTLTRLEVDMCFQQVRNDVARGRIHTPADELESLLRYRTALQIVKIESEGIGGLNLSFPENVNEWTFSDIMLNSMAAEEDTEVWGVHEYFSAQTDFSEVVQRMIVKTVMQFNSVVARLEANSNNPDFWKAIG